MLYKIQYFNQVGGLTTEEKNQLLDMGYSLALINDIPENIIDNFTEASNWVILHSDDLKYKNLIIDGSKTDVSIMDDGGKELFFGDSKIDLSIMDDGGKKPIYSNEYSKFFGIGNPEEDGNGQIIHVINPKYNEKINKIKDIKFNLKIIELQQVTLSHKSHDPNKEEFYDKIDNIMDGSIGYKIILHEMSSQDRYEYDSKSYILDKSDDEINNIINSQKLIIFASERHYTIFFSDDIKDKVEKFFQVVVTRSSGIIIDQINYSTNLCDQMNHSGNNLCDNNTDINLSGDRKVYTLKKIITRNFKKFKYKLTIPQGNDVCYIISIFCAIFLKLSDDDSIKFWNLFSMNENLSEIIKKCN